MFGLYLPILFSSPPPAVVSSALLSDNFNDGLMDATKWNLGYFKPGSVTTGVTVNETTRLEITPNTASATAAFNGYVSVNTYDMTNRAAYVNISSSAGITGGVQAYIGFGADLNNSYLAIIANGTLYLQQWKAGSGTNPASFAYNATTHAWIRLRYDGTTVYIDTATSSASNPPAPGDWTNQVSAARDAAISLTAATLAIGGGCDLVSSATILYFDDFAAL